MMNSPSWLAAKTAKSRHLPFLRRQRDVEDKSHRASNSHSLLRALLAANARNWIDDQELEALKLVAEVSSADDEQQRLTAQVAALLDWATRSVAARKQHLTKQLEDLARRDPLTGLYNSRALAELLNRDLAHARRRGRPGRRGPR